MESPLKKSTNSVKLFTGNISIPSIMLASREFALGKIILLIPNFFASIQIGKIPFIFSILPFKDNSPMIMVSSKYFLRFEYYHLFY